MIRTLMGFAAAGVVAATLTGTATAAECAAGESEAVLVTDKGSITICVDENVVEAQNSGVALALEAVECPCAAATPSANEWSRMKDEQSCEYSGGGLLVKAMKGGKGKRTKSQTRAFYAGGVGDVCSYQVFFNGLVHHNTSYVLETSAVAQVCETFARDLYASFAGSKRQPASCPQ